MSYKIKLEMFEGPLDLLLHLIKKEELSISDISITRITEQYLEYLNLMELLDLDIAGDFLVMAATLMHIKSKMLLPPDPEGIETDEEDPRSELVRRLLQYKAFKEAAERLKENEEKQSGIFGRVGVEPEISQADIPIADITLFELLEAFNKVLKSIPVERYHEVVRDEYTVAEKVHEIFHELARTPRIFFSKLFNRARSKVEAITVFLAILELIRLKEVLARQDEQFGEIEISRNEKMIQPVEGAETHGQ